MAKQVEGVYERVLECAEKEFLEKGYTNASLRVIAANADTSTNSIYVRFKDKEGLFSAIVEPVVDGLMEMFMNMQDTFHGFDKETQLQQMGKYSVDKMDDMIDYMYDNLNAFRLLLDASYGTKFNNFLDKMVWVEVDYTYKYMDTVGFQMSYDKVIVEELLHFMTTSYFEGVFEVIRHNKSRDEAKLYVRLIGKCYHAGFTAVFYPKQ